MLLGGQINRATQKRKKTTLGKLQHREDKEDGSYFVEGVLRLLFERVASQL
jgi:hypothetical protein